MTEFNIVDCPEPWLSEIKRLHKEKDEAWDSRCLFMDRCNEQADQIAELKHTLQQFCEVSGLSPIEYPGGRKLPDPELEQDPAYLAFKLENLEGKLKAEIKEKFSLYDYCRNLELELDNGVLVSKEDITKTRDEIAQHPDVDIRVHMYAAINGLVRPGTGIGDMIK